MMACVGQQNVGGQRIKETAETPTPLRQMHSDGLQPKSDWPPTMRQNVCFACLCISFHVSLYFHIHRAGEVWWYVD